MQNPTTTACQCVDCPGATCTCGCQAVSQQAAATACTCGESCACQSSQVSQATCGCNRG